MECLSRSAMIALMQGETPSAQADLASEHLAVCSDCRERAETLRRDMAENLESGSATETVLSSREDIAPAESVPQEFEPPRGTELGRYLMLERLGAGGMGMVISAYDPELNRKVAVKLLRAPRGSSGSTRQARLLREAQAMARLSHPNVVPVYDVGTYQDRVFVAMELVEGTTLKQWLRERPRSWRDVVKVFLAAGRGLAAAHAAGLVHRDFKPENVLMGRDGRVRVTDFGLARALGGVEWQKSDPLEDVAEAASDSRLLSTPLTRAGVVVGTLGYMAPEQYRAQPSDARSDQFSFCVSLYGALYGERPFGGKTVKEAFESVTRGELREPPKGRGVPPWVRRIVVRGLSGKPEERYPSMDALLEALEKDPSLARRRWLGATGAVALVGMAAAGVYQMGERQSRLCKGAERKLAGVWDEEIQTGIRRAFLATGKPYAEDAWTGVERLFKPCTEKWLAMHTDACEATRVRGEQSEEVLSLRMECLEQRRKELLGLTRLFLRADAEIVENAVRAVGALADVELCQDVAALRAPLRPPAGETQRRKVEDLRQRLADIRALLVAGRYRQGIEQATPVAAEAAALGYAPLEAEALTLLGELQHKARQLKEAEQNLKKAVQSADAGRHDRIRARALTLLTAVVSDRAQFEQGYEWGSFAAAAISRLEAEEELRALLEDNLGWLHYEQGKVEQALARHRRALEIREHVLGPDHPETAYSHNALTAAHAELGEYDEARIEAERAVAIWEKALGSAHPQVGVALANLAGVLQLQGNLDEALAIRRRAASIQEKALGPDHPAVAVNLTNMGAALVHEKRKPEEALPYLRRALAIKQESFGSEHPSLGVTLTHMGAALRQLGRLPEALSHCRRAVGILTKTTGVDNPGLAYPLTQEALVYLAMGMPEKALALLERALALQKAKKSEDAELADARFGLARALWETNRDRPRAIQLAFDAQKSYARLGRKQDVGEVNAWIEARR